MDIILNFLSSPLLGKIREFIAASKTAKTNIQTWSSDLAGVSGTILLLDILGELADEIKAEITDRLSDSDYADELANGHWYISVHLGTRLSYIPWHADTEHDLTITIYLNENWDINWAGYFLFKLAEDQMIQAVFPQNNLGLIYRPPMMHSVAMSNIHAPVRESLQLFIDRKSDE